MPIYEYKCLDCGNNLEAMQKISDEPLRECPKCSGKLEKQWSRTGVQFKGTGWYVTDYAGKGAESKNISGEAAAPVSDATKSSPGESTTSGNGASKPETKSNSAE